MTIKFKLDIGNLAVCLVDETFEAASERAAVRYLFKKSREARDAGHHVTHSSLFRWDDTANAPASKPIRSITTWGVS